MIIQNQILQPGTGRCQQKIGKGRLWKDEIRDLLSADPYKMEVILNSMMPEGSVMSFYMHFHSFVTEWEVAVDAVQEIEYAKSLL
jgi:hypothetical protein